MIFELTKCSLLILMPEKQKFAARNQSIFIVCLQGLWLSDVYQLLANYTGPQVAKDS